MSSREGEFSLPPVILSLRPGVFWQVLSGQPVGRRDCRPWPSELVPGWAGVNHPQAVDCCPELLWTDSLMMAVLLVPSVKLAILIVLWRTGRR